MLKTDRWVNISQLVHLATDVENIDKSIHIICNDWSASYIDIIVFIEDIGHFASMTINNLFKSTWLILLRNIAFLIFDIVNRFMDCLGMQNKPRLQQRPQLCTTLLFWLVKFKVRDISRIIIQQNSHVDYSWSPSDIDKIGYQFEKLCTMYKNVSVCQDIDSCDHHCSFDDVWTLYCLCPAVSNFWETSLFTFPQQSTSLKRCLDLEICGWRIQLVIDWFSSGRIHPMQTLWHSDREETILHFYIALFELLSVVILNHD